MYIVLILLTVQVLGHKPTTKLCFLTTHALAVNLMEYMKAPVDFVGDIYTKHLTILANAYS